MGRLSLLISQQDSGIFVKMTRMVSDTMHLWRPHRDHCDTPLEGAICFHCCCETETTLIHLVSFCDSHGLLKGLKKKSDSVSQYVLLLHNKSQGNLRFGNIQDPTAHTHTHTQQGRIESHLPGKFPSLGSYLGAYLQVLFWEDHIASIQ